MPQFLGKRKYPEGKEVDPPEGASRAVRRQYQQHNFEVRKKKRMAEELEAAQPAHQEEAPDRVPDAIRGSPDLLAEAEIRPGQTESGTEVREAEQPPGDRQQVEGTASALQGADWVPPTTADQEQEQVGQERVQEVADLAAIPVGQVVISPSYDPEHQALRQRVQELEQAQVEQRRELEVVQEAQNFSALTMRNQVTDYQRWCQLRNWCYAQSLNQMQFQLWSLQAT